MSYCREQEAYASSSELDDKIGPTKKLLIAAKVGHDGVVGLNGRLGSRIPKIDRLCSSGVPQ